jgi:hypothetical protein
VSGFVQSSLRVACAGACMAAFTVVAQAQNVIPVLPSVNVRLSNTGTSVTNENTFGSAPLNLSCPSGGISAMISGALPTGSTTPTNLLVDNFISVTANSTTTNLCGVSGPATDGNPASCFRPAYSGTVVVGTDPDYPDGPSGPLGVIGGVAPIDISSFLTPGANQITLDVVDFGGYLASSTINLVTNCSPTGALGSGKITGNPITTTNLVTPFNFSTAPNLNVQFLSDFSTAQADGTLTIPAGSTPVVSDQALAPSAFPTLVAGTSFATSQCLIHLGEFLTPADIAANNPACKIFTLVCQIGNNPAASGANCPKSTARNIVLQDVFDFPPLALPDITYTNGNFSEIFHQGFGFLENDNWTGGFCTFDVPGNQGFFCPLNVLTEFSGPGLGNTRGSPQAAIQSSFISVGPVPEYRTHVDLLPWSANKMWVNSHDIQATFNTRSPILPANFNGGDLNGFVAAPPYSLTYGVAPLAGYPSIPSTEFPVPGDETILYPGGCPAPGTPAPAIWRPAPVQVHVDTDGKYLLHFFATDCAGTEELYFRQDNTGSWFTTFYTAIMFVDTVKPEVTSGPVLSCAPHSGEPVVCYVGMQLGIPVYRRDKAASATYQCSDDFSGVAQCGAQTYGSPVTTPPVVVSPVDTSKLGQHTYTVNVTDAAGNVGTPVSVTYYVIRDRPSAP